MKRPIQDWFNLLPKDIAEKALCNWQHFSMYDHTNAMSISEALRSFDWTCTEGGIHFWSMVETEYENLTFDESITVENLKRIGFKKIEYKEIKFYGINLDDAKNNSLDFEPHNDLFRLFVLGQSTVLQFNTITEIQNFISHFKK